MPVLDVIVISSLTAAMICVLEFALTGGMICSLQLLTLGNKINDRWVTCCFLFQGYKQKQINACGDDGNYGDDDDDGDDGEDYEYIRIII